MNAHAVAQSLQPLRDVATALQVRALRDSNASAEKTAAVLKRVRDEVFTYRHTAEALVAKVDRSPRLCAGVLALLANRVAYSRVDYDLFDEIVDKEFMAQASTYISAQMAKVIGILPEYEIVEVFEMVHAYESIDDANFYLTHCDTITKLDSLLAAAQTPIAQKSIYLAIAALTLAGLIPTAVLISPLLAIPWAIAGVVAWLVYRAAQQRHADTIKRTTALCADSNRVRFLQARFHTKELAKRELESHKRTVKAFFGDMSPSSHLSGIFAVIQMHINIE
ncbi:MAG: hypothetical protein DWI54_04200 [Chloroflexi bacterium]|nr:MAG: hypothetical protein DWI54_04200 [Chloroflexota bacterium]